MKKIIIATKNVGKAKEFEYLFAQKGFQVTSLLDYEEILDVIEDGETFAENAKKKAEEMANFFNLSVIGDDSGLIVDALQGRPGVYSARYAGEQKDDEANLQKVLQELKGVPEHERTARFFCALAVAIPGKETKVVEGTCEGSITFEKHGEHGFGYDPIFYVPAKNCTMAELSKEEKNAISHRANALKKLSTLLEENEAFLES